MVSLSTFLPLACALIAALVSTSLGCSPPIGGYEEPTVVTKLKESQVVVWGQAERKLTDRRFQSDYPDVYAMEFRVGCVFKGSPVNDLITIYELGSIPGHCVTKNMTERGVYLAFLDMSDSGRMIPRFKQEPGESEYIEEFAYTCDMDRTLPIGDRPYKQAGMNDVCVDPPDYEGCAVAETTTTTKRPPMPPKTVKGQDDAGYQPVLDDGNKNTNTNNDKKDDDDNSAMSITASAGIFLCLLFSLILL